MAIFGIKLVAYFVHDARNALAQAGAQSAVLLNGKVKRSHRWFAVQNGARAQAATSVCAAGPAAASLWRAEKCLIGRWGNAAACEANWTQKLHLDQNDVSR